MAMASSVRVGDTNVKECGSPSLPERVNANIRAQCLRHCDAGRRGLRRLLLLRGPLRALLSRRLLSCGRGGRSPSGWGVLPSGRRRLLSLLMFATGFNKRFVGHIGRREGAAAKPVPFPSQVIMADVHAPSLLAGECMLNRQPFATAIAVLGHVKGGQVEEKA